MAELVPLLLRLCGTRLALLQGQASPPPGPLSTSAASMSVPSATPTTPPPSQVLACAGQSVRNCNHMLAHLVQASQLDQSPRTVAAAPPQAELLAAAAVSCLASGSLVDAGSCLHSREVFAAHAVDIIALQEGEVRAWLRQAGGMGMSMSAEQTLTCRQEQFTLALQLACTAGLGSAVLRQCYSLFCVLLKSSADQAVLRDLNTRASLSVLVAKGAAAWLACCMQQQQQQPQAVSFMASAAASVVPSLVIIGRCFLQLSTELQAGQPDQLFEPCKGVQSGASMLIGLAHTAQQWVLAHSPQMAAAGYPSDAVLQQLGQLGSALQAVVSTRSASTSTTSTASTSTNSQDGGSPSPSSSTDEVFAAAVQQLHLAGASLSSLAVPCLCNNPGCSNTAGMTELSLVSGRSCLCGGCRVARYCTRACQRAHWRQHKPVCTALAAAAAAASGDL